MTETNFWLIRHAIVDENARAMLYGVMDVPLCETSLLEQAPMYRALAARLPRPAAWKVTPLSRTRRTAEAIFAAGYPRTEPEVEPDLIEQSLGEWQGLPHAELPARLSLPKHAFWPLAGHERPPGGETMAEVIERVGAALERLADAASGRGRDHRQPRRGDPCRGGALPADRPRQCTASDGAEPVAHPAGAQPGRLACRLRQRAAGLLSPGS